MLKLWVLLKKEGKSDNDLQNLATEEQNLKDLFTTESNKQGADKAALTNENNYFFTHYKKGKEIFSDL